MCYVFLGVAWIQLAGNKCVSSFRCVLIQNRAKTILVVAKSNETTQLKWWLESDHNDGWYLPRIGAGFKTVNIQNEVLEICWSNHQSNSDIGPSGTDPDIYGRSANLAMIYGHGILWVWTARNITEISTTHRYRLSSMDTLQTVYPWT